jgi:hypothetical protein
VINGAKSMGHGTLVIEVDFVCIYDFSLNLNDSNIKVESELENNTIITMTSSLNFTVNNLS